MGVTVLGKVSSVCGHENYCSCRGKGKRDIVNGRTDLMGDMGGAGEKKRSTRVRNVGGWMIQWQVSRLWIPALPLLSCGVWESDWLPYQFNVMEIIIELFSSQLQTVSKGAALGDATYLFAQRQWLAQSYCTHQEDLVTQRDSNCCVYAEQQPNVLPLSRTTLKS